ncbi:unnamed protein product [Schistosoma rodhaini]|uniref:GIY-YIG domain-containing protein n=1 Tax=Schistosoma rodhaini TaxID=6188 RepID=A0AA85GFH6_9TREM|nr:unnamed protein product [Schistosoma rodhaini]
MKLKFNGDVASDTLKDRLRKVISRTFYAAYLALTFSSRPVMCTQTKDKLHKLASSMCIYKFSCSCGDSYIGRTTRQLNQRISEHLPAWFGKGQIKTINSSILAHLIDSGHIVVKLKSFQVIYRIPPSFPNGVRSRLFHIAEVIGICTFHPNLCTEEIRNPPIPSMAGYNLTNDIITIFFNSIFDFVIISVIFTSVIYL